MTHQSPAMRYANRFLVPAALAAAFALAGCGGADDEEETPTPATVVYVDGLVVGGLNNGTSWANAYTSLTTALANAPSGAQVWIRAGTYKPTATTDRTISFTATKALSIYGSFDGTETALDQRDLSDSDVTLLSGDIGTASVTTDDTHQVLRITAAGVVLDGIEVAFASGSTTQRGAGIDVAGVAGLTLRNVIVRDCLNPATGSYGAGLVLRGTTGVSVRDCVFADSIVSSGNGAGVHLGSGSSATFTNCLFTGTRAVAAGNQGAALYADTASVSMINCTVYDCDSNTDGPVYALTSATRGITVLNSVFAGNANGTTAGSVTTGGIFNRSITYCVLESTTGGGIAGSTIVAPTFEDSGNAKGADGRYGTADDGLRLDATSSGVGNGLVSGAPNRDITGASRGTLYDRGAYDQLSGG